MNYKQKVKFGLVMVFFAWGTSLGIRYQTIWDALGMYCFAYIIYRYGK